MKFNTKCVKAFYQTHENGASTPNLNLAVVFNMSDKNHFFYRRYNSTNNLQLAKALRNLYELPKDFPVMFTNCGLTAYTAVCKYYKNKRKIVSQDVDDECQSAIRDTFGETIFINVNKIDNFLFRDGDILFVEPLSNPMLKKYDIKHICEIAHKQNVIVIVDNSILSVVNYNPFNDGVDIVIESGTKWLCGSGDAMLGIILGLEIPQITWQNYGLNPNPLDCYLVQKGIPTLPIRINQIKKTAKKVFEYIKTITNYVIFDERIGIITFCLGDKEFQKEFCKNLQIFFWGAAFGQNCSTIQNSDFKRIKFLPKPFNWCLRLSIGLEDSEDLIADIQQAYKKTYLEKKGQILENGIIPI